MPNSLGAPWRSDAIKGGKALDIRLTATSLLMPGNSAWRSLGGAHHLEFGAFGDWSQVLADPGQDTAVAWVVFLDDIVEGGRTVGDGLDSLLATVLAPLDARLARGAQEPVLVAWASLAAGSVIEAARTPSASRTLAARFEAALYERARRVPALHVIPLDQVFAKLGRDRLPAAVRYETIVVSGDPAEQVLNTARRLGADLIVMGTHGRRLLSHLVLGSVAERVVRESAIPVLTAHATTRARKAA